MLLAIAALSLLAGAWGLVRAVRRSFEYTCVVCVTREGREVCREAVGATRDAATDAALSRACGYLTVSDAERAECVDSARIRVECRRSGGDRSVLPEVGQGGGQ